MTLIAWLYDLFRHPGIPSTIPSSVYSTSGSISTTGCIRPRDGRALPAVSRISRSWAAALCNWRRCRRCESRRSSMRVTATSPFTMWFDWVRFSTSIRCARCPNSTASMRSWTISSSAFRCTIWRSGRRTRRRASRSWPSRSWPSSTSTRHWIMYVHLHR